MARLRSLWLSINASYWFYPGLLTLLAVILSLLTVYLDRNGAADWIGQYDWLHPAGPEGARTVLTVIAGSMIGVAATVFSVAIAAVAYASGNYGPRLLTNFMEDKGNQLSLGVFIATFVYAVMILRAVRSGGEGGMGAGQLPDGAIGSFTPQLSLLIAVIIALLAITVLVYFLHHIPASIRINQVLKGIGSRLITDIRTRYPTDFEEREPHEQDSGEPVSAHAAGYVKIIDFDGLDNIAKDHDATVALKIRTGDFIHPEMPFLEISGCELSDDLRKKLQGCFALGGMRTAQQDLEFLIDELVEIALRALSPGINDPFTAVTSLHWIAAATAELARRDLDRGPEQENYDWKRVQPLSDDFEHFLKRGFGAIRASAAASAITSRKYLDALSAVAGTCSSSERKDALRNQGELLLAQAKCEMQGPSLDELEDRFKQFSDTLSAQ